ncbi:MAG: peptidase domain-containing ABC transporter [Geminicoccaceae bacterium]
MSSVIAGGSSVLGGQIDRANIAYIGVSSLFINVLSICLPVFSLQLYDRILVNQSIGTLAVLSAGVLVCIILEVALRLIRSHMMTWAGATYEHHVTCRAVDHLFKAEPLSVERSGVSVNLQSMAAISKLRDFIGGQATVCLIDLPFVLIYLALIAFVAGHLVIVPLTLLALFTFLAWFGGLEIKKALIEHESASQHRVNFLIETLGDIHSVKAMAAEAGFLRRYERMQRQISELNHRLSFASGGAVVIGSLCSQMMVVAVTGFGASMVVDGAISVGTLIASVLLSGRIMQPIQRALSLWIRYHDMQLAKTRVQSLFSPAVVVDAAGLEETEREGQLELRDLVFDYGDEGAEPIIDGVSLSLKRGDIISVSASGAAGKSTLLKLMAGLARPTPGSVLIDGVDAHRFSAEQLASHVGYLATTGTIFNGTVRENLSGFDPKAEVTGIDMARLLGIDDVITSLPLGYETLLRDSGSDAIPTGLRQCIALARVLARRPRLLLFDNADRALDRDNYNHLYRLLGRLKGVVSMVIISDDRNFVRMAKQEYTLADGKLTTHQVKTDSKAHNVSGFRQLRL